MHQPDTYELIRELTDRVRALECALDRRIPAIAELSIMHEHRISALEYSEAIAAKEQFDREGWELDA